MRLDIAVPITIDLSSIAESYDNGVITWADYLDLAAKIAEEIDFIIWFAEEKEFYDS